MKELIKIEFKKLWTPITILSILLLVVIILILNFSSFFAGATGITSEGELVVGLRSFRIIKKESQDIKGTMDGEYLEKLVKQFNNSQEKLQYRDYLRSIYNKYQFSNYIINFANYGLNFTNFKTELDFDFLISEDEFYNQYKQTLSEVIKVHNQNNWFKYNDKHMDSINNKIENLDTPFNVGYHLGIHSFVSQFGRLFFLVFIPIAFVLSSLFSKDSFQGIDELTLASKYGRKKNMNSRIIVGNIFAIIVYTIFIITQLIVHSIVFSLEGWGLPIQNLWFTSLYNISLGTGVIILIVNGLLAVILLTNLIMLISIIVKYSKVSTILSLASIGMLLQLTNTTNYLFLQLNPIYFATRRSRVWITNYEIYYFIGDTIIPYTFAFILVSCVYILIIRLLMLSQYKRYKLN